MFKRQYRIQSGVRITSSQAIATPFFHLKKGLNHLAVSRFGFVVSKKIDKRAVVRNRTRRVLRSIVEDLFPDIKTGFDLLFIIKKPIEKRTEELEKEVKDVLEKAGISINDKAENF